MKRKICLRWLLLIGVLVMSGRVEAQRLVLGAPGADLKIKEYVMGKEPNHKLPLWIEFFYSSSNPCRERLASLDDMARRYTGQLEVLLLTREDPQELMELLEGHNYLFTVALDDEGKTFAAYDVRFVPFSVFLDHKDRIAWFGNAQRFSSEEIDALVKSYNK